ncbi:MAG: 4Fe-4S dicluster domain-containing protein [Pirellulales bacterium]|nr:4Fe-4S dicluster domain-containing protein [Pirellulales bacterium]
MTDQKIPVGSRQFLPRSAFEELFAALHKEGYSIVGPKVTDGAVRMQPIGSVAEMPQGIRDNQDGGFYRLEEGEPELWFEYVVGPNGPKEFFFPAQLPLFEFHVQGGRFDLDAGPPQVPKLAFLGVRPCELAAIDVQDRVFGRDDPGTFRCESEPWYLQIRQEALLIAVNCTRPGGTCFCASWGTGPEAAGGYDLALTELKDGFVVAVGSKRGAALAENLSLRAPSGAELELATLKMELAREHMGRQLETPDLKQLLNESIEFPEWDDVARRCLSCGNCTMVCPTCFCCTVSDGSDLSGQEITRTRFWESCFSHQFTYTIAGPERNTIRGRYRHWLRHKLCTWWDQFECSGCVGCGRCITWCPVGIDLTEEAQRLREGSTKHKKRLGVSHGE